MICLPVVGHYVIVRHLNNNGILSLGPKAKNWRNSEHLPSTDSATSVAIFPLLALDCAATKHISRRPLLFREHTASTLSYKMFPSHLFSLPSRGSHDEVDMVLSPAFKSNFRDKPLLPSDFEAESHGDANTVGDCPQVLVASSSIKSGHHQPKRCDHTSCRIGVVERGR